MLTLKQREKASSETVPMVVIAKIMNSWVVISDTLVHPNHTGNLTTILTGHGNIEAYLNRFQISDDSTCPCGKGEPDNTSHNL